MLYVARNQAGAIAETLLRNPQRRTVDRLDIESRALTALTCRRALRVVRLHGTGLQQVGADNSISTGPYGPCGLWSDAFWQHRDVPDGIAYLSRHDTGEVCLALFERPDMRSVLEPGVTRPLMAMAVEVAEIIRAHGKSIEPPL